MHTATYKNNFKCTHSRMPESSTGSYVDALSGLHSPSYVYINMKNISKPPKTWMLCIKTKNVFSMNVTLIKTGDNRDLMN